VRRRPGISAVQAPSVEKPLARVKAPMLGPVDDEPVFEPDEPPVEPPVEPLDEPEPVEAPDLGERSALSLVVS
jgi:hypothetical protein